MKIAIVGSRNITVPDIGKYISNADEIISGGAVGVDQVIYRLLFKVAPWPIFGI